MQRFVNSTGVDIFPNVNDANGQIWREFGISYQPAFVFRDAEGNTTTTGALSESNLQDKLTELF